MHSWQEQNEKKHMRGSRGGVRARFRRCPTKHPNDCFRQRTVVTEDDGRIVHEYQTQLCTVDGYELLRVYSICDSGKKRGGGVCLYINKEWSIDYTVCDQVCTPYVELLTLSLRPFYLPREFTNIIMCSRYVLPKANCKSAADVIAESVSRSSQNNPMRS